MKPLKHPKTKKINMSRRGETEADLKPLLMGRIFHVTLLKVLDQIMKAEAILANTEDKLPKSVFGSSPDGYFRKQGCVSLFDFRNPLQKKIDKHFEKCSPFKLEHQGHNFAFLFLTQEEHSNFVLNPWIDSSGNHDPDGQLVPHVEAGYRGRIPISAIEEIWEVTVTSPDAETPASMWA